jgi:hypothetical protein
VEFEGDLSAPADPASAAPASPPSGLEAGAFNAWSTRLKEIAATPPPKAREFHLQGVFR